LAKYRSELIEASTTTSEKGEGFEVKKNGVARVTLVGFPSAGKVSARGVILFYF
jgi:ribosome-interacting GTPase 1